MRASSISEVLVRSECIRYLIAGSFVLVMIFSAHKLLEVHWFCWKVFKWNGSLLFGFCIAGTLIFTKFVGR